jgi:hypothetical protein
MVLELADAGGRHAGNCSYIAPHLPGYISAIALS